MFVKLSVIAGRASSRRLMMSHFRPESESSADDVTQRKDLEFATEFLRIFLVVGVPPVGRGGG